MDSTDELDGFLALCPPEVRHLALQTRALIRHVQITSRADLEHPALRALIEEAVNF